MDGTYRIVSYVASFFSLLLLLLMSGWFPHNADASSLHLLIPLYSCPSDENGALWESVEEVAQKVPTTVIWGIICEEDDYPTALHRLGAAGARRLAYIATHDSQRPLEAIQSEMAFYAQYPIDGFFFDEVNPEDVAAPKAWVDNAKAIHPGAMVFLNSPYAPPEFIHNVPADGVIIFEDTFAEWQYFDATPYRALPPTQLAALVHSTPATDFSAALMLAERRGIGWVYVTNRGWDSLPTYFSQEAAWLTTQFKKSGYKAFMPSLQLVSPSIPPGDGPMRH